MVKFDATEGAGSISQLMDEHIREQFSEIAANTKEKGEIA